MRTGISLEIVFPKKKVAAKRPACVEKVAAISNTATKKSYTHPKCWCCQAYKGRKVTKEG